MAMIENPSQRKSAIAVFSLLAVALFFALALLIGLPLISRVDPVGANVMKHRLREAFCKPRIEHRMECLHECARKRKDYKKGACEQLPGSSPTEADQKRVEAALYDRSPCAAECQTSWKSHALWCKQGIEKAKLDAVDACIFEGATMALFDWKEARCRTRCPGSDPGGSLYLSSADDCMLLCLMSTLVEDPDPHDIRQIIQELRMESDFGIRARLKETAEPPTPEGFEDIRHQCRLEHPRATFDQSLEVKREKEISFKGCVRTRLDAFGRI